MEDTAREWPQDKLNALRLGRRLVAQVATNPPGRRGFVDIDPVRRPEDAVAESEGWVRADRTRSFLIHKWEWAPGGLDGRDYDIGAQHILTREASDESHLGLVIAELGLEPASFKHPWETEDPR